MDPTSLNTGMMTERLITGGAGSLGASAHRNDPTGNMNVMTVIVLGPRKSPGTLALASALEAGIGPVRLAHDRAATAAALAAHPRSVLVLDLREAGAQLNEAAARLRGAHPAVRTLALLGVQGTAPPHCDAVFATPVFLEDVVRWCARSSVTPLAADLLEDLAAGLCHEIGNPLTSLFLQLELLQSDDDLLSVRAHLRQIEDAARRIQAVVRDVAQAAERHPVRARPTRLGALLDRVADLLQDRNPAFDSRLQVELRDAPIEVDVSLLAPALADLAEYLLRAGGEATPLSVQAEPRESSGPVVRLCSAVPRLPPDAAGRLFTPLWARQALGLPSGLSLTSARTAFLRHRGDVRARHLPDGRLLVEAWLPAEDQAILAFPPPSPDSA